MLICEAPLEIFFFFFFWCVLKKVGKGDFYSHPAIARHVYDKVMDVVMNEAECIQDTEDVVSLTFFRGWSGRRYPVRAHRSLYCSHFVGRAIRWRELSLHPWNNEFSCHRDGGLLRVVLCFSALRVVHNNGTVNYRIIPSFLLPYE